HHGLEALQVCIRVVQPLRHTHLIQVGARSGTLDGHGLASRRGARNRWRAATWPRGSPVYGNGARAGARSRRTALGTDPRRRPRLIRSMTVAGAWPGSRSCTVPNGSGGTGSDIESMLRE